MNMDHSAIHHEKSRVRFFVISKLMGVHNFGVEPLECLPTDKFLILTLSDV